MTDATGIENEEGGTADLVVVLVALLLFDIVVLTPLEELAAVRPAVVVLFCLFGPGYAVIAGWFPTAPSTDGGLSVLERLVLGVGASIGLIVGISLLAQPTRFGIGLDALLVGVNAATVVAVAVAWSRRRRAERPGGVSSEELFGSTARALVGDRRLDTLLTVAVIASVVLAGGMVYAMPDGGAEGPTEAYLLTEDDGSLVAEGYPDELTVSEPETLYLAITGDDDTSDATVIVSLQRLSDDRSSVETSTEIDRFNVELTPGETTVTEHEVVPTVSGEELRLTYLVYFDGTPTQPGVENADRQVHLWVTVLEE